jgi:hypothetical protein
VGQRFARALPETVPQVVIRNRVRVGRRQVLPGRNITDWKTSDPAELKRQLFDLEKHLGVLVEQNAQLLAIVNGNETPTRIMPERDHLQFRGTAVAITQDSRDTIATIGYEGLDGIDTETGYVRSSHDRVEFAPAGGSTNHNVNPTGWDTADDLFVTAPSSLATATGFAAPSSDGTLFRKLIVDPDSPGTQFAIGHLTGSDSGNQVYCPGGATLTLNRGGSALLYHPPGELVWFVVATSGAVVSTSHSALTNLNVPGDHLWALLRDGTRSLQGTWSLGGNTLNNAGIINSVSTSNLALNAIGAGADIELTAADTIRLVATAGGVAISPATTLVVNSPNVDMNLGASGLDVDSTGEINFQTTNGNIVIAAAGSGRDVVVTATDDISLAATDDTFVTAGSVLSMGAPDLVVNATNGADVDIGAAGMTIDSTGTLAIATNGANINITAAGGTRDVNVTATGEINLNAPVIDANNNPIRNADWISFLGGALGSTLPGSGYAAFGALGGFPQWNPNDDFIWGWTAHQYFNASHDGASGMSAVTIDFSSIAGKNLSDGVFVVMSAAFAVDSASGSDSYLEVRIHYVYFVSGAPTTVTVSERLYDNGGGSGLFFIRTSTGAGPLFSGYSASGQVLTITRSNIWSRTHPRLECIKVWGLGM